MDSQYSVHAANDGLIIEADNLYALSVLEKDYTGKIDVMPIDPPYNTQIGHIGYNDMEFKNGWQAFMRPRIEIAYRLLSATGVIFIHIDENELFNLSDLCKEIFGQNNIEILIWKKINEHFDKNRIEKPTMTIRRCHEYIIICYKDRRKTYFNKIKQPVFEHGKYIDHEQYLESVLDNFGTTSSAKDELYDLLGNRDIFSTPKPMRLIKEFIRTASGKNAIILDFFAGSGTTGHAVMDLNKEDNGMRKFILITNNENNICRAVTMPRIQKAIDKYGYPSKFNFVFSVTD